MGWGDGVGSGATLGNAAPTIIIHNTSIHGDDGDGTLKSASGIIAQGRVNAGVIATQKRGGGRRGGRTSVKGRKVVEVGGVTLALYVVVLKVGVVRR